MPNDSRLFDLGYGNGSVAKSMVTRGNSMIVVDASVDGIKQDLYHGHLKSLALAVTGAMDAHFTALWDHGHIKFWSIPTLTRLLEEAGLKVQAIKRVSRLPPLAKSMVLIARKRDAA